MKGTHDPHLGQQPYYFLTSDSWYVSNRFATEPAGFGDALLLDAFMRYDNNAYDKDSNPEVSGHCYYMNGALIRCFVGNCLSWSKPQWLRPGSD